MEFYLHECVSNTLLYRFSVKVPESVCVWDWIFNFHVQPLLIQEKLLLLLLYCCFFLLFYFHSIHFHFLAVSGMKWWIYYCDCWCFSCSCCCCCCCCSFCYFCFLSFVAVAAVVVQCVVVIILILKTNIFSTFYL